MGIEPNRIERTELEPSFLKEQNWTRTPMRESKKNPNRTRTSCSCLGQSVISSSDFLADFVAPSTQHQKCQLMMSWRLICWWWIICQTFYDFWRNKIGSYPRWQIVLDTRQLLSAPAKAHLVKEFFSVCGAVFTERQDDAAWQQQQQT